MIINHRHEWVVSSGGGSGYKRHSYTNPVHSAIALGQTSVEDVCQFFDLESALTHHKV